MLPQHFLEKFRAIYPTLTPDVFCKKPVSFRVNTRESSPEEIEEILTELGIAFKKNDFLSHGYILPDAQEKDIWHLPFFTGGKIYLQGIASQIAGEILRPHLEKTHQKILDACAAPGWKTSHICMLSDGKYHEIHALEPGKIRRDKLAFTLARQGCTDVQIHEKRVQELSKETFGEYFDVILVDAPCSSEGKIDLARPKSFAHLSESNKKYYRIQKEIVTSAVDLLSPWGILLYTTCTLDPLENEGIVHFLLSNFPELEMQEIPFFQNMPENMWTSWLSGFGKYIFQKDVKKSVRLLPSKDVEWFFYAVFRKKEQ